MPFANLFEQLIEKKDLSEAQMQTVLQAAMTGQLNSVQTAAFLSLMRAKGETAAELSSAAKILNTYAKKIDLGPDLIDIVGTGGDGRHTFNVSTASSFVVAATGVKVAKHGNRSVSSHSGSTDLLSLAGIPLFSEASELRTCMQETGLCFLFAPYFHPAMRQVKDVRQQLGIKTLFNLLGPLLNPAQVKRRVVGVYSAHLLEQVAHILIDLGSTRALIVHAEDGLDEISIAAKTNILEYHEGQSQHWQIDPRALGCFHENLDAICVRSPAESLAIIKAVLQGQQGAARDMILLNSAAALYCAGKAQDMMQGMQLAAQAIDSGEAWKKFLSLSTYKK